MEQLGQKLLCTILELEKLKAEAMEEMRKNKEYVEQLTHLLKYAIQERDEARNQIHRLLNKTMPLTTTASINPMWKANSSITDQSKSLCLSDTYNYHSHGSSPVLDAVSSPEFSIQECNAVLSDNQVQKFDQEWLIIDNLAKGRVLPQRGKLLQAVVQAGPLLQTLLVAGRLPPPRWRNPPQFHPFRIPPAPMSIKGCEAANVGQLSSNRSMKNSQTHADQLNLSSFCVEFC